MKYLAALLVGACVGVAIVLIIRWLKPGAIQDANKRTPPPSAITAEHREPISDDELRNRGDEFDQAFSDAMQQEGIDPTEHWKLLSTNPQKYRERNREIGVKALALARKRRPFASTYRYKPPIILLPESRAEVDIATDGNSWFGGLPHLGQGKWPRSRDGSFMHPVAQIDLAELAELNTPDGLPKTGSLAFFVDFTDWRYEGEVVYVPEPSGPTQPMENLPRLFMPGDSYRFGIEGYTKENAPRHFPRWPIKFVPITGIEAVDEASADKEETVRNKELAAKFPKCHDTFSLTAYAYKDTLPELAKPTRWDSAQRFANLLTNSRASLLERTKFRRDHFDSLSRQIEQSGKGSADGRFKQLGQIGDDLEFLSAHHNAFIAFETEVVAWAYAHDQWDRMHDDDVDTLNKHISLVRKRFADETPGFHLFISGYPSLDKFVGQTLREIVQSTDAVYNTLPQQFRDDVESMGRFARHRDWHQMFGVSHTNYGLENHRYDHLLLKLGRDHLQHWRWGEESACFWITPEDLQNQRWENVSVVIGQQ